MKASGVEELVKGGRERRGRRGGWEEGAVEPRWTVGGGYARPAGNERGRRRGERADGGRESAQSHSSYGERGVRFG